NGGCWSLWGMGVHYGVLKRIMNLPSECWEDRSLLHELGHAFGLIHEHQRADRDGFVEVHYENLAPGFFGLDKLVNFMPQNGLVRTPYDFLSVMHYSRNAGSKNGKDTIVPRPGFEKFIDLMGRIP